MLAEWQELLGSEIEALFGRVNQICGCDLLKLVLEGPEEELNLTFNAQPAILAVSILLFRFLQRRGACVSLAAVAGHSLGEYSALCAAESITFEEAIFLVRKRGELMQEAVPEGTGTMVAIVGLPMVQVEEMVAFFHRQGEKVEIANVNSSEQVVLSLPKVMVEEVLKQVKERGGKRAIELRVSAPFHSSYMKEAAEKFRTFLEAVPFKKPRYPYVSNVTASYVEDPEEIKRLLIQQMTAPVRWKDIMDLLYRGGARGVVEVGPGVVLSKLFEREYPAIRALNTNSLKAVQSFLREAVGVDDW